MWVAVCPRSLTQCGFLGAKPAGDRLHDPREEEQAMSQSDVRVDRDPAERTKFVLDEERIPKAWYNIAPDLPVPPQPVLNPGTGQPIGPGDLAPLFPMALIRQEVSAEREIEIPQPVRAAYRLY